MKRKDGEQHTQENRVNTDGRRTGIQREFSDYATLIVEYFKLIKH